MLQQVVLLLRAILQHLLSYVHMLQQEKHKLSRASLEIVEVAHRGSTAGGRVVRLRVRLGRRVLGIYL